MSVANARPPPPRPAGSYGSTKRYKAVERIFRVNKRCVVGASGEISDFQQLQKYLDELAEADYVSEDGIEMTPQQVHSYLTRVMYNYRNKYVLSFACVQPSSSNILLQC